jgi:hypothetical protein
VGPAEVEEEDGFVFRRSLVPHKTELNFVVSYLIFFHQYDRDTPTSIVYEPDVLSHLSGELYSHLLQRLLLKVILVTFNKFRLKNSLLNLASIKSDAFSPCEDTSFKRFDNKMKHSLGS